MSKGKAKSYAPAVRRDAIQEAAADTTILLTRLLRFFTASAIDSLR